MRPALSPVSDAVTPAVTVAAPTTSRARAITRAGASAVPANVAVTMLEARPIQDRVELTTEVRAIRQMGAAPRGSSLHRLRAYLMATLSRWFPGLVILPEPVSSDQAPAVD